MENWKNTLLVGARFARSPFRLTAYAGAIERLLLLRHEEPSKPPLFILGLPRSGTTLVYQYIVHRLTVAYFTNGVGRFPRSPCLATFVQHKIYGDYSSDFESQYGKVKGPVAPREAGGFWGSVFGLNDYVTYDDMSKDNVSRLRRTVACIENIYGGRPFVNKNVKHLLRIGALRRVFPDSRFLIVERNRTDVALSLLRGRREATANPKEWLSVRPPNYRALKDLPLAEQVAGQLTSLQEQMEADILALGGQNILRVNYEKFCDRPEYLIELLETSFGKMDKRNPAQERFKRSERRPRNNEEKALVRLVENHAD